MIINDLKTRYNFELLTNIENSINKQIETVYIGDLLSWVMGKATEGCAWVTIQGHVNIVAVAMLVESTCIIVCEDANVTDETIQKANDKKIPILKTNLNSYEVAKIFIKEDV